MTSTSPPGAPTGAPEKRPLPGLDVRALQDWLLVNQPVPEWQSES